MGKHREAVLTAFMEGLFDAAWEAEDGCAPTALTRRFDIRSALHVFVTDADADFAHGLTDIRDTEAQAELLNRLEKFEADLQPVCAAQVVQFPVKPKSFVAVEPVKVAAA